MRRGAYTQPLLIGARLAGVRLGLISSGVGAQQLSIPPTIQQTPVWCWAAVSEMVLRHFGFPTINPGGNYQCGIVALLGPMCSQWCGNCVTPIGSGFALAEVINTYQEVAWQFGRPEGQHFQARATRRLSIDEIADEIADGRPVAAGISPSGMGGFYPPQMSEHVTLIVGADTDTDLLLVNDPMPYGVLGYDPYIQLGAQLRGPGRYAVPYAVFAGALGYKDSLVFE
jgi:hypothetical protein